MRTSTSTGSRKSVTGASAVSSGGPLPKIGTPINFIDIFAHANIPAIIEARIHYPLKPSSMWIIEERENCDCSACKYREENKEPIFISCDENGNYLSPSQMKKIKRNKRKAYQGVVAVHRVSFGITDGERRADRQKHAF